MIFDTLTYDEKELAEYLYGYVESNYRGEPSSKLPNISEVREYYDDRLSKRSYDKVVKLLYATIQNENFKYYEGKIQLDETRNYWELEKDIDQDTFWQTADDYLDMFEEETGVPAGYSGRSFRHVLIENNVKNFINYKELWYAYQKIRQEFIDYLNDLEVEEDW